MKLSRIFFAIFFFLLLWGVNAQTPEERQKITSEYNREKLLELAKYYSRQAYVQRKEALQKAKENNWPVKGVENGRVFELMRLTPDGKPVYYQTENYYAAKTIRTDRLYSGGELGINIQGQNMIVGLWDADAVRATHHFLQGKVEQRDGATFTSPNDYNRHATHVCGTMIATNTVLQRGMAFDASAWTHDWYSDNAEMAARAAEGLLVSNHSYGLRAFNAMGIRLIDLYWFGKYSPDARDWDEIMYNAPYYLVVDAAGNDRQFAENGPNKGGYDMLTGNSTNKNGITVAAVHRVTNYTGPNSVRMSSFSNWGPTDDGRIKPDISAQGVNLNSCVSDSDDATAIYSGTSMAAPTVTGSSILLQQLHNERYGNYIRSATLRGLILHTADEAGSFDGPDYAFGWGLMNTARAAKTILDNGLKSEIREITLQEGETYTFTVKAAGNKPLMASICWTDPPGEVIWGTADEMLDNPAPALVNDLDIRITKGGTTYYPWVLNPQDYSAAATKGDNTVDNFEKIQIDNPDGEYTVTVSHKGTLKYGKQDVSIIITGIYYPFAINTTDGNYKTVCADSIPEAEFHLLYSANTDVTGATSFSLEGAPAGATVQFSPPQISADGNVVLRLGNLNNVEPGIYNMNVVGVNGNDTITKALTLQVLKNTFTPVNLIYPPDGSVDMIKPFRLEWEPNPNAQQYRVQIASNPDFNNILQDEFTPYPYYEIDNDSYGITDGDTFYWRVKPVNRCAEGEFSDVYSFTTINVACTNDYLTPSLNIPSTANTLPVESSIDFSGMDVQNLVKVKVTVYVDISHTKISDLGITLVSPNNTEVVLNPEGTCQGNYSDIQVLFDDDSPNVDRWCNTTPPALSGDLKPYEPLSTFAYENPQGQWTLRIYDPVAGNGGTLNLWAMEICNFIDVPVTDFDTFEVWPNPARGQINLRLDGGKNIDIRLIDMSGKEIFRKHYAASHETFTRRIMLGHLQKGVYFLIVNSDNKHARRKIIVE